MTEMRFGEFVETNPKIKLEKGKDYDFVEMADIEPSRKYVYSNKKRTAKGGSKFRSGDVLFARITPCLEHGKIALFKSENLDPAFGSTEFYIFREKEGISDKDYIYYISKTDIIRKPAEKSMVGASGRQRANIDSIKDVKFDFPDVLEQRKIASILTKYDDLIENNVRRINVLEKISELIYQEWFSKFKFPGHEKVKFNKSKLGSIPGGWEIKKVSEILKRLKAGSKYTQNNVLEIGVVPVIDQSTKEFLGWHNNNADHDASPDKPIMVFGDHTCKMRILVQPFSVGPNTIPFISLKYPELYIFFLIKNLVRTREYKRHWNELIIKDVALPDYNIAKEFSDMITPIFSKIMNLEITNVNLLKTRDILLPKLIQGEVNISQLDIIIPEVEA